MSSFNKILEIDNIKDDSISSLKNLTKSDLSYIIGLNKLINLQKNPELKNPYIDNKTEIFAAVFQWDGTEKNVYLTGSFCNWLQFFEMRKFESNENNSIQNNNKLYLITLPSNKIEEGTTDCTTSHITVPKLEEVYNKINSLNEFSYKDYFNYDLFSNQNKLIINNFLQSKEKDILNGNYSFKKIFPTPHEYINHFVMNKITFEKLNKHNQNEPLKLGCTLRYHNKMTTYIYYKPKKEE